MTEYKLFENYIIRTPVFPLLKLGEINAEDDLKETLNNPAYQEALFLASPNLYEKLNQYLNNQITREKDKKTLPYALLKYISRITSRATPFGLFAGVGIGRFGEETCLLRSNKQCFKKVTRLDMNFLYALSNYLSSNKDVRNQIKFYANTSLYEVSGKIRYVEYIYNNVQRKYRISSVDNSEYLERILKFAERGTYLKTLVSLLQDDGISKSDAVGFVEELIDNQILISELDPQVTGNGYLESLLKTIKELKDVPNLNQILNKTYEKLENINNKGIGIPVGKYNSLKKELEKLDVNFDTKYLYQSDLYTPFNISVLNSNIKNDIYTAMDVLERITDNTYNNAIFEEFKKKFIDRFEEEEVPLSFVFDSELGLGYRENNADIIGDIAPLVDDLRFSGNTGNVKKELTPFGHILLQRYVEAIQQDLYTIQIERDVKELKSKGNWKNRPDTFSAMIYITQSESGQKVFMNGVGGGSATNLVGRFGHLHDSINEYLLNITEKEHQLNKDKILAEVVHLPQTRTGNILYRPVLRKYEIPFLAQSSVEKEFQLPLKDLFLSHKSGRIVLRSKRLDKVIIPKMSNAHNYSNGSLPIYHFLCDLQNQNLRPGISFNWGLLANKKGFLPRVEYKNIVLSRAMWNFTKQDMSGFNGLNDNDLLVSIHDFKKKWKLPERVSLVEGDNELFIDLTSPVFIRLLLDAVKKKSYFQLVEYIYTPDNSIVKDNEENSYMSQFVVAFYKKRKEKNG